MISGIGGGMPSMDAMRQMQQKMFNKADADGSGGIDSTEFESMVKSSPMGGAAAAGTSPTDAFKKIDGDADGQLSVAEMEAAQKQMMERFQTTMQAFGQPGAEPTQDPHGSVDILLDAIGNDDERDGAGRAISNTDDLLAQLREMADRVNSTYGGLGERSSASLVLTA